MTSPFLPPSQCMVIHDHTTIHGRYNPAYCNAVALPNMICYMKKKQQWQTGTANLIHWKWFKSAVRRHSHASSNHLTKLFYNQLATPICQHCNTHKETFQQMCNKQYMRIYTDSMYHGPRQGLHGDIPMQAVSTYDRVVCTCSRSLYTVGTKTDHLLN
jgi:hypothetical protein